MKIATKLTKKVAEFVNENRVNNDCYEYSESENFFHYPGIEIGWHESPLEVGYTLVSEQEFIDLVTAELAGKTDQVENRQFDTGSIRDNDDNKPLVNHLSAYLRLRFGYLLRKGANKYGKGNWKLGQPTETALESLHRHLANYELGDRSEDHLSAIIFNVQLIMQNEQKEGIEDNHYFYETPNKSGKSI